MTALTLLPSQRDKFDIPDEIAYFNCAYMGPMLNRSRVACEAGVARKSRPWTLSPADFFGEAERVRALFAEITQADAEGVALIPSASYGVSLAANALPIAADQTVVVLKDQFPSNVYPWRAKTENIVAVDVDAAEDATAAVLAAITVETAVAALPQVLWTTGVKLDLAAIGARCREVGAALVLDVTQSLGAWPYDNQAVQPDFLIAANYKWLLGPYTTGQVWIAPKWRSAAPFEHTWLGRAGSEDSSRLIDYTDALQPGARPFDMGERSNFALLPGVLAAFEQILDWGVDRIAHTLTAHSSRLAERLAELGLSCPGLDRRAGHYLTAKLPDTAPTGIVARLAEESVFISQRGDSLRITPHLWLSDADEDRFVEALARALA